MKKRCKWSETNELMTEYHDNEWGVPVRDNDNHIFEHLCLEVAQAGLSWNIVLQKRENYKKAFDNFNFEKVYEYDEAKIDELMQNTGIIRNAMKIKAMISNAKVFREIREEKGSFSDYIWSFVNGIPILNDFKSITEVPTKTKLSEEISKNLKLRGFKFVGPVGIYAFMQSIGLVNDHIKDCFKYKLR